MRKVYFVLGLATAVILVTVLHACKKSEINKPTSTLTAQLDTISRLDDMKTESAIWNDNGVYRQVTKAPDEEDAIEIADRIYKTTCPTSFTGSARATAKTTFATAGNTNFSSFSAIRSSVPSDSYMRSLGIGNSSTRTTQENVNVNLTSAYIYAICKESDDDLHMIIGDVSKGTLTNCESSGFPATSSSSYTAIKAVRDSISSRFGTTFCSSGYTIFSPPVHVTLLQGSLFYDIDHSPGSVGPSGYKPASSWEVHPLKLLKFH